jgi:gamma-glutamylcyclotransferase (GGCT)/AIG2-like uncharacterized protein YtfP
MDRLFVYGIFLDESTRLAYGMSNPEYTTVKDYITFGDYIVEAVPVGSEYGVALTGLVVDINPEYWGKLDALERGYNRIKVKTISDEVVYMYVTKG